jgi:trimethylamine--corrinoid protein Co-methyltransferase
MSPALAAAAGIDFIVMGGLLDALMAFDFGQLVIDNEIAQMLKRFRQHLALGDVGATLDEIRAAGPAGMYVASPNTVAGMKTAALLPTVADRERRALWRDQGGTDAHARALARAKRLLSRPNPHALPAEVDARVRAGLPAGLVAGDSVPDARWGSFDAGPARVRRGRRRSAAAQ